jgi:hypothetical protein
VARQQLSSPFQSYVAGRDARQQYEYGQTRNKLADMELADAPAQMQRRNALADVQLQTAQTGLQGAQQQLDAEQAKFAYAKLKQASDSGNPKAFITQQIPELAAKLQQQGIDLNSMDDQSVAELTDQLARKYAGDAGIAPAAPATMTPYQQAQIDLERDKLNQPKTMSPYETARIDIERQKLNKPGKQGSYRTMTPAEIEAAGLPAGTSAQVDQDGKINVLSKRDTSATLSQKDANTAKLKLNTVKVARNQLQKIKAAYEGGIAGVGPNAFGGAQGWMPTQAGKKFDAAVDQMRSTLTALTRVPGVGAMSDYETRLDQAKFPSRTDYESVTAEKIQGIDDMLNAIESGYSDLLSGGATQQQPPQPTQPTGEVKVSSPQEAMALPPGTVFITPDGRRKVR